MSEPEATPKWHEGAYEAVRKSGQLSDVHTNARIWRAVEAALDSLPGLIAEVWDEGYWAGQDDTRRVSGDPERNPYKQ